MSDTTLGGALRSAQDRIDVVDAQVLLRHVAARDAAFIMAHPEAAISPAELGVFTALVDRRVKGEPVAYLTGEREFYGRPFKVSPAVLIPRPETELLVDLALERVARDVTAKVLDLGTGSGCIAIAIASERPNARVLAVDRSPEALAVARRNAVELRVGNVAFLQSDWFEALTQDKFEVIVCNPPYVALDDPHLSEGDVQFEPRTALAGGADGLEAIRHIVGQGARFLVQDGWLLMEHGHDQAAQVRSLFQSAGFSEVASANDVAGIARVTGGRLTVVGGSR